MKTETPLARLAFEPSVRHFSSYGFALLAWPHDGAPVGMPPLVCSLHVAEMDATHALTSAWESSGREFFYWLARIDYSFRA